MLENNDNIFGDEDEECPLPKMVMGFLSLPRPLGILWPIEKIKKFLKARGYLLLERIDPETEELITVACKSNDEIIPETGNLVEIFTSEVEDILMDWLLKIGENGRKN